VPNETAGIDAVYIDTSALVKLYFEEPDSEACEAKAEGMTLVSSRLLYCEFRSALLRKVSLGKTSTDAGAEIWDLFERDIATDHIRLISIDDILIQEALGIMNELHPKVPLRTLDALHLSTYLSIDTGPLFTMDHRMNQAAASMGLQLVR
jgi:uncharacterized protein